MPQLWPCPMSQMLTCNHSCNCAPPHALCQFGRSKNEYLFHSHRPSILQPACPDPIASVQCDYLLERPLKESIILSLHHSEEESETCEYLSHGLLSPSTYNLKHTLQPCLLRWCKMVLSNMLRCMRSRPFTFPRPQIEEGKGSATPRL